MVFNEAIPFVIEAKVNLADPAEDVELHNDALLTAELVGLPVHEQGGKDNVVSNFTTGSGVRLRCPRMGGGRSKLVLKLV